MKTHFISIWNQRLGVKTVTSELWCNTAAILGWQFTLLHGRCVVQMTNAGNPKI